VNKVMELGVPEKTRNLCLAEGMYAFEGLFCVEILS